MVAALGENPWLGCWHLAPFLPRFSLVVEALDLSALLYRHNMLALVKLIIRHLSKTFNFPEKYAAFKLKKKIRKIFKDLYEFIKEKNKFKIWRHSELFY